MNYFWIDRQRDTAKTSEEFISDLKKIQCIKLYNREKNPYDMLLQLVTAMICGKETYLLDDNISDAELLSLGVDLSEVSRSYKLDKPIKIDRFDDIVNGIKTADWCLWLFTSGTTGIPKKVCHSYKTLGRSVRCNLQHVSDVWAFAYKMSHMAGVQVLLQALVNKNRIVYVFEDSPENIVKIIQEELCTCISATPTFYRNLLPFMTNELSTVRHITLGGEKYDEKLCEKIRLSLPNAKIHNIYASTETGSILASTGNKFYIPDKYKSLVRISPENELCIHKSLLGDFPCDNEWYNTHDLVEIENNGALRFLSRKSDLINVGGYKVNPLEIEEIIQQIDGVVDCVVKGRKNSVLGSVLIAEIVGDKQCDTKIIKQNIIEKLKKELQAFKIPRIYHFVEFIERTRSGKKVRK